jgi:uncharacterized protein YaaQ
MSDDTRKPISDEQLLEIFGLIVEAKRRAGKIVTSGTLLKDGEETILLPTTENTDPNGMTSLTSDLEWE